MGKYDPLAERLAGETGDRWSATFAEVEALLGADLPKAARVRESWWTADPDAAHSRAWAQAGWRAAAADLGAERVEFARADATGIMIAESADVGPPPARRPLGLNPAWLGGVVVGAAGLAGTLLTLWMRRRR